MTTKKQKENALRIESEHASYVAQKIYEEAEKKAREICEFITGDSPLTDYKVRITAIEHSDLKQICNAVSVPKAEMSVRELFKQMQERCRDHVCHSEGRLVNHDNPEDAWGEHKTANELLEFAESLLKEQTK